MKMKAKRKIPVISPVTTEPVSQRFDTPAWTLSSGSLVGPTATPTDSSRPGGSIGLLLCSYLCIYRSSNFISYPSSPLPTPFLRKIEGTCHPGKRTRCLGDRAVRLFHPCRSVKPLCVNRNSMLWGQRELLSHLSWSFFFFFFLMTTTISSVCAASLCFRLPVFYLFLPSSETIIVCTPTVSCRQLNRLEANIFLHWGRYRNAVRVR